MKKNLLLSASVLAAATAIAASPQSYAYGTDMLTVGPAAPQYVGKAKISTRATESVMFTYAQGIQSALALNNTVAGKTRVTMGFMMKPEDIKNFAGNKVTGFTVFSPTDEGNRSNPIPTAEFCISTDMTEKAYVQDFSLSSEAFGDVTVNMDEAYTITGNEETIFFGYTIVVPSVQSYYLPVDGIVNDYDESCMYGTSDDDSFPAKWGTASAYYGALSMLITIEGDNLPKGMTISNIPDPALLKLGEDSAIPVAVKYYSGADVNSLDMAYAIDGKDYIFHYDLPEPAPAAYGGSFSFNLTVPAQDKLFNENVEFKVVKMNGEANESELASFSTNVYVVEDVPVHQTLFEEYTGTWCGYCTRGYAALEYIRKNYPDFVVAAYHNNDAMQVTTNYPTNTPGYPSAVLDRTVVGDPYFGTEKYQTILPIVDEILAMNAVPTPWSISVSHTWDSDTELTAHVDVKNVIGYESGKYKLVYILVADGLTGTTSKWIQANNYSSQQPSSQLIPELNAFCRGGTYGKSRVKGLVFNDVVVSTTGIYGVGGSVPTALAAGEVASHSQTFDLSKISETLIPDKNKLRIIAAVADSKGNILNCAKDEVNDATVSAVEGVNVDSNAPVEYFNLNGVKVAEPSNGIFIRRQGNSVSKVVVK